MALPYERELQIALLAVQRASLLTKRVLAAVDDKGALSKSDDSPVTVADFGAQALLISALRRNFPTDGFVGEESAGALRADEKLSDRVWDLVRSTRLEDEQGNQMLGEVSSREEMLDAIDHGAGEGGSKGRIWVMDPIDGTKSFMTGGQYAVCLALVEDGTQRVGVLGCPNLNLDLEVADAKADVHGSGVMLSAVCDQGAYIRTLSQGPLPPSRRIEIRRQPSGATQPPRFLESSGAKSADMEIHRRVAANLAAPWPGTDVFSLQMRYVAIAVSSSDVMLRIPLRPDYHEYIWDHAGGVLILEEAGGKVTDLSRHSIDFGKGRRLQANYGLIAATSEVFDGIFSAVGQVTGRR